MFRAHMQATDNVRPILITDCGSLQPGRGPSDYWLRLQTFNAHVTKLMQRPHQVDLVVPFVFLNVPWNPASGNAAFIPKEGQPTNGPIGGYDKTPVANFFELWRDFDGRRINISFDQPWLDAVAVHHESKLQLALTNMGGKRLQVDRRTLAPFVKASTGIQKRMYYRDGSIHYKENSVADLGNVPIDVEETSVILVDLKKPPEIKRTVDRQFYYAGPTAVKFRESEALEFPIDQVETNKVKQVTLVVGIQCNGGIQSPLQGSLNGQAFSSHPEWSSKFERLFAPVRIKVNPETLKTSNVVTIKEIPNATITSVHLEVVSVVD